MGALAQLGAFPTCLHINGALIHCSSTDRKLATALNGTRRDEATPSIFGYSMTSKEQEEDERNAKRKTTRDICHQKGTGNNGTNGRLLLYVRGNA